MKFVFVDEENIGFKELELIDLSILDKVFVFSNKQNVKEYCSQKLYISVNGYPQGSNQADFLIISYLSKVISNIPFSLKGVLEMTLYTKDKSLILAFEYLCAQSGIYCSFPYDGLDFNKNLPILETSIEDMILQSLSKPKRSNEIMVDLKLELSEFTSPINTLIKSGKIMRNPLDKKQWILSK